MKMPKKPKVGAAPHPTDKLAGERLRIRRRLAGMSQGELGKAIGVSFQQVQKYENGANRMSASCIHKVSSVLGVTASYFFDELPAQPAPRRRGFRDNKQARLEGVAGKDAALLQDNQAMRLIRAFKEIKDAKKRRQAIQLIKSLADK